MQTTQDLERKIHHSFALTFLPDSSSASASAYSSSRCFLYILAVCGRFIFSLNEECQYDDAFTIYGTEVNSRRRQKFVLDGKRVHHQVAIPDSLVTGK